METNCKEEAYDEILKFIESVEENNTDLDSAAEKYAYQGIKDEMKIVVKPIADEIIKNFKAGAKWMANRGVTIEKTIGQIEGICAGNPVFNNGFDVSEIDVPFLNSKDCGYGDKVIVQIRKQDA